MSELVSALTRSVIDLTARVRALELAMTPIDPRTAPYIPSRPLQKSHISHLINDAVVLFGIDRDVMLSRCRTARVAHARQWVMYEASMIGYSLKKIGNALGGMDHTTVMHGIRAERQRRAADTIAEAIETQHEVGYEGVGGEGGGPFKPPARSTT